MLFHVVLPGEGLVADWAVDALLTRMLLAVSSCMARGGEGCSARVGHGVRARVFVLLGQSRIRSVVCHAIVKGMRRLAHGR